MQVIYLAGFCELLISNSQYNFDPYSKALQIRHAQQHHQDYSHLKGLLRDFFHHIQGLFFLNYSGKIYLLTALILSGYYVFISYQLFKEKNHIKEKKLATKLFGYSILYLFMIFTFILIDKFV